MKPIFLAGPRDGLLGTIVATSGMELFNFASCRQGIGRREFHRLFSHGIRRYSRITPRLAPFLALLAVMSGCQFGKQERSPTMELTRIPPAAEGGPDKLDVIEGRVSNGAPGQQIVVYEKSGNWWVQPLMSEPYTHVRPDGGWTTSTHVGTDYAALLVDPGYRPAATLSQLPAVGGGVAAVVAAPGSSASAGVTQTLSFGGYEWRVRSAPSSRGGRNEYEAKNAFVDPGGALHLRISKKGDDWSCAEVTLTRSLGYGTYSISVLDVSKLEPAAVFSMITYDYAGGNQNNREMDMEVSRWGEPGKQFAQFVVQPFYVPANVARFVAPEGALKHTIRWEAGRAIFQTTQEAGSGGKRRTVAEHAFTSGIPNPGSETVRMNLYYFRAAKQALRGENEVVIERFEYLP